MASGSHDHADLAPLSHTHPAVDHTHADLEESGDVYTLQQAILALDARLGILEAGEPEEPPPTEPPPTPGNPPANLQAAIDAAPSGGTVDATGGTYSTRIRITKPLTLVGGTINAPAGGTNGTPALYVGATGVTVRGVTIKGNKQAFDGITLDRAVSSTIEGCTILDVVYAGIITLGARDCVIKGNTIRGVIPLTGDNSFNAYGITLSYGSSTGNTSDTVVEGNTIENIPTWHGLDTHAGVRVTFRNNVVKGCRRAMFLTSSPTNVLAEGNDLTSPTAAQIAACPTGSGVPTTYCQDIRGVSVFGGSGIIRNNIGRNWPSGRWFNSSSTGVSNWTFSGNTPVLP